MYDETTLENHVQSQIIVIRLRSDEPNLKIWLLLQYALILMVILFEYCCFRIFFLKHKSIGIIRFRRLLNYN